MSRPQFWVIAGPNGAGKSTVARTHFAGRIPIVNPDDIADRLRPHHGGDPKVVASASREALAQRNALLDQELSFAIETTLTGHSELRLMVDAKARGYKVNLIYIGLESDLHSHGRVKNRVARGGHNVPPEAITRRYPRSMRNLPIAMQTAHRSLVIDNSGKRFRLILSRENRRTKFISRNLPKWARQAIPLALRRSMSRGMEL